MTDTQNAPLANLSLEEIGSALIMLVPTCLLAGHESVKSTLGYVHGKPGGPAEFVKDVLTLAADEVARKWYGGEKQAAGLAAEVTTSALLTGLH